ATCKRDCSYCCKYSSRALPLASGPFRIVDRKMLRRRTPGTWSVSSRHPSDVTRKHVGYCPISVQTPGKSPTRLLHQHKNSECLTRRQSEGQRSTIGPAQPSRFCVLCEEC